MTPDTFVIGDVHGHVDRLEALLLKAETAQRDCIVVQLGDLGHFGNNASRTGDMMAWQLAFEGVIDFVLWGNHDRAVIDASHMFRGYQEPDPTTRHIMKSVELQDRLLMAYEAHGWLLTHAGLHAQFKHMKMDIDKTDPRGIADHMNRLMRTGGRQPLFDAISGHRGGWLAWGGVLWRDIGEKLYTGVPQVFGHSASPKRKVRGQKDKWWCIDVGGKGGPTDPGGDCLVGMWLPSQELVRVDLYQQEFLEVLPTAE